jgi:tetratricopeptide (TPR) repeat protein
VLASSLGRLETARAAAYRAVRLAGPSDTAGAAYGLNAAAVAEWALGDHERSLDAHRQAITLLDQLDDPWGLAVCQVLQARTLYDLGEDTAAAVARTGVEHARRAGDRHVLGIALTQIARIAIADHDTAAAISAASEALALQERIGYTEGIISALHVLGHAHRASGDTHAARRHHQRALGLAARIGHAAAMCEAVEDLASDEHTERPVMAAALLRAARTERARRQLPLRQRDSQQLGQLEQALTAHGDHGPYERTFDELVAEMIA